MPIDVLVGELRAIGINEPLNEIPQSKVSLQPINELGEHFVKMLQPDDTLLSIALACREPEVLEGEPSRELKEMILEDRVSDLDHMAGYLKHGPAALDHFIRLQLGGGHIDLPATAEELRAAVGESDLNEINLNDVHYHPLGEQGKKLLIALSPYESIAAANLACTLLTVPGVAAPLREVVASALRLLPQRPMETMSFICPLTVSVEDGDSWDLVEGSPNLLVEHEDEIRDALKDEVHEGKNMADYLPDALKPKIASMEWDVTKVQGTLYGSITCKLRAPLTNNEQSELVKWISGQNSDGLGEGFEQRPIKSSDGELYVSLWHSGDDYYVLPEDEFQSRVLQTTSPAVLESQKPDCPLLGADGNVFNLIGIASRTLRKNGLHDQVTEMRERAMSSGSYDEALGIITDYVNPVFIHDDMDEEDDDWCREPEYDEDDWTEEEQGFGEMGGMT